MDTGYWRGEMATLTGDDDDLLTDADQDALYWSLMNEATRPAPPRPATATDDPDLDDMPF